MKVFKINKTLAVIGLYLLLLSSCGAQNELVNQKASSSTWIIKNALVYDGLGKEPVNADVRIENGAISGVGLFNAQPNDKVWQAEGLALAPGFIDPHSHHDTKLMQFPAPKSALAQGITTIVSGLDGGASTFGDPFVSIAHNFSVFQANPAALNLAYFAPHDNYREIVMGDNFKRAATQEELKKMGALLRRDLDAGA